MYKITTHQTLPFAALFGLAAIYGCSPLLVSDLDSCGSIEQQIFMRCGLAYLILLAIPSPKESTRTLNSHDSLLLLGRIIVGWGLGMWTYVQACLLAGPSITSFLSSIPSAQLWAIILLSVVPTRQMFLRWGICFLGVSLFQYDITYASTFSRASFIGALYAIACGLCVSFSTTISSFHRPGLSSIFLARVSLGGGALCFGVLTLLHGVTLPAFDNASSFGILALSALFLALSSFLWQYLLKHLSVITISNALASEGLFTAVFAWLINGEWITRYALLGGLCIILANLEITWPNFKSVFGLKSVSTKIAVVNA